MGNEYRDETESLLIISTAASVFQPGKKKLKSKSKRRAIKKYPQITEMQIRTGLVLSRDVCVWRNMVGNWWWNFYFTNYRHGAFARDQDHRHPPQLLQIIRGPQVILIPCE